MLQASHCYTDWASSSSSASGFARWPLGLLRRPPRPPSSSESVSLSCLVGELRRSSIDPGGRGRPSSRRCSNLRRRTSRTSARWIESYQPSSSRCRERGRPWLDMCNTEEVQRTYADVDRALGVVNELGQLHVADVAELVVAVLAVKLLAIKDMRLSGMSELRSVYDLTSQAKRPDDTHVLSPPSVTSTGL